jgi:hypothetical protein
LDRRELSSEQLVEHYLENIERYNPRLNAYLSVQKKEILINSARISDENRKNNVLPSYSSLIDKEGARIVGRYSAGSERQYQYGGFGYYLRFKYFGRIQASNRCILCRKNEVQWSNYHRQNKFG